jgi:SAM-dependent methyltransferase
MENNGVFDSYYDWTEDKTNLTLQEMQYKIFGFENSTPDILPNKINDFLNNVDLVSILDYGAGLGRNLPLLQNFSNEVDYADLVNYENKFSNYIDSLNYNKKFYINGYLPDTLYKNYDLIYASVVLQHIIDDEIYEKIVKILAERTKYLLIVQNSVVPVKNIINLYYDFIIEESEKTTFKGYEHTFFIYKSKL